MTKYSVEEVRDSSRGLKRIAGGALSDYEGVEADENALHKAAKLLRAYAERIKADESTVPFGYAYEAPHEDVWFEYAADRWPRGKSGKLESHMETPLFTHPPAPAGEVVITRDATGSIVAVTRQDAEGEILSIIAEAPAQAAQVDPLDTAAGWLDMCGGSVSEIADRLATAEPVAQGAIDRAKIEAVIMALTKLTAVIRQYGVCAPAALETLSDTLQSALGDKP